MSSTYQLRTELLSIARQDVGKVEVTRNQATWIKKYWTATHYPDGHENREPYCAAAMCYWVMRWLYQEEVRFALGLSPQEADQWRCKSPSVFRAEDSWLEWAKSAKEVVILPKHCILHAADIAIYSHSHMELVSNDDNTTIGPFLAIGANTNAQGSRDGEGCYEKPRSRSHVRCFIRMLE